MKWDTPPSSLLKYCTGAALEEGGNGITGTVLGTPFPIPQNGLEVVWNHLTRYRGVVGVNVADAFGAGETNNGGHADNLPLYKSIAAGTPVTVPLHGGSFNELGQNRYYRWTGVAGSHTVQIATSSSNDVDVEVFKQGVSVAVAQGNSGSETTGSFTAVAGADYVIVVTGFGVAASGNYSTVLTVH